MDTPASTLRSTCSPLHTFAFRQGQLFRFIHCITGAALPTLQFHRNRRRSEYPCDTSEYATYKYPFIAHCYSPFQLRKCRRRELSRLLHQLFCRLIVPVFLDDLQHSNGNRYPCQWVHISLLMCQQRGMRRWLKLIMVEMGRAGFQRQKSSGTIMMPILSAERPEACQT